jgi:hypothetical protein
MIDAKVAEQRAAERAERAAHLQREARGEARGYAYAIECFAGWVGVDNRCTHREPVLFNGDRESANARAQHHRCRNDLGGAVHHSPCIVPEAYIAQRVLQLSKGR